MPNYPHLLRYFLQSLSMKSRRVIFLDVLTVEYIFNTLFDTGFCPSRVYTTNLVVDISNCHPFLMSDIVQEGKFVKI